MGGIGVYTQEIVRALLQVDRVNEYLLIYPGFGSARTHRGKFREYENAIEIETSRVPLQTYWDDVDRPGIDLFKKARALVPVETHWDQIVAPRMAKKYGVDVLFNPHLTVPILGRFGKVTVMHSVEYHNVPDVYTLRMYIWWYLLENVILRSADRLITVSNTLTETLSKHLKYPLAQMRTIYHGVNNKFRRETDLDRLARTRQEYKLPEHFILFVGRLYPEKNFATLARAFARIKDTIPHSVVVAGEPRYKFDRDLQLIRELGIGDRIVFLNHVPNDTLPMLYNLAACFVLPSIFEACPLVILEAMACGCPIVASKTGAIPELVDGAAILIDPHSVEELSQALLKVTCSPEVRRDLTERELVRAREFTWERAARQTLEVFKELV
jgi:glycosyltransferase involved in cell wall biosynthesis